MYVAIDDTYGPNINTGSKYVTGDRRTNVAVAFLDDEVEYVRQQVQTCLEYIEAQFSIKPNEFHFVEIYNRKNIWANLPERANLAIFSTFADIYKQHKWKVFIQTVDEHTLKDHGVNDFNLKINKFNLKKPSDLSLFFLLIKIKKFYANTTENLTIFIDEGLGKPEINVGQEIFHDFINKYTGKFKSSHQEPLVQIADFIAFALNRVTHLSMKEKKTDLDNWFLELIHGMEINSTDLKKYTATGNDYSTLTVLDFDKAHEKDRVDKGLPSL